jgi:hypothetical protein
MNNQGQIVTIILRFYGIMFNKVIFFSFLSIAKKKMTIKTMFFNKFNFIIDSYGEFNMRPDTIDTYGTPYDYYSIMHYRYNTFALDSNLPTMVPKDVSINMFSLGNREDLSPIDIMKIKKYYNCA